VGRGEKEQLAQEGSYKLFWHKQFTEPGMAWLNLIPGSPDYEVGVCHPAEDLVEVTVIYRGRVVF
jgi:hypothetical protein